MAERIEVLADRGYFKSEEIAACEEAGIKTYVPKPLTSNARAEGRHLEPSSPAAFLHDQHSKRMCASSRC